MIRPEEHISFNGRDWVVLKAWLNEVKENKIGLLIRADTQEKSDKIRGTLAFIQEILALEKAATNAAAQGLTYEQRTQ